MSKRKIIGSAIVGNIVEYYDFGIYAAFAPLIGKLFFPESDQVTQVLYSLIVFAMGFLARPLGGIVFGHIGDKMGRKVSLTISIVGMALCTFFIGILPSYEQIGVVAPAMLVMMRLFQGLCVGGEGAGTAIFVLEHLEGYRPGLIGSVVMASNMVGTLLATFTGILIHHFFGDNEASWRYGFIFGSMLGVVGLYMRYHVNESPVFEERRNANKIVRTPLFDVIIKYWPRMLVVMFIGGTTSAVAYTIRGYFRSFFSEVMHYSTHDALYFTLVGLFVIVIFLPLFGLIADKTSYRKFMYVICFVVIILALPSYMLVANEAKNPGMVLLGILLMGLMAAAICAPAYPYAIRAFEVELRFSGVAFSWNLGHAMFGGTTPAISLYIANQYGPIAPAYYLMGISFAFIVVSFLTRRYRY